MPDQPTTRQRKKVTKKAPIQPKSKPASTSTFDTKQTLKLVYAGVAFVAAFLIYKNPGTVQKVWDDWIGSSEWEAPPPGTAAVADFSADVPKRDAVVAAFKHAWLAYERDAMGDDEYHPISFEGTNLTEAGGIGYTVVDSIDTMQLMGLTEEYGRAREWVATKMSFERDGKFNTFETTIRVLGGLLSAYHLSDNDPIFLEKAVELADRIMPVFDTPSGLPLTNVNLAKRVGIPDDGFPGLVSTAEISTLQLEFKYLSALTGDDTYWQKAEAVMGVIKAARMPHGLASIFMDVQNGVFVTSAIRLGSRGDSYYEYLLKQYLQTNGTEDVYKDMYQDTMEAIHTYLIQKSTTARLTYTAELIPEQHPSGEISWRLTPKQDHLVCFLGGSLMLGAVTTGALVHPVSVPPTKGQLTEAAQRDWRTGYQLIKTCMATHDTATGLAPEIVHFRIPSDEKAHKHDGPLPSDWYIRGMVGKPGELPAYDARYILRPETVESLFIAWRLTGDVRFRNWGWDIFQSIEKHCRVATGGYASILNVDANPSEKEDKMETFLMSETLKYLYLMFADDSIMPLDKYVFNTEAHPFPIFNPTIRTGFS